MAQLTLNFNNLSGIDPSKLYVGFVAGAIDADVSLVNLKNQSALKPVDDGNGPYPNPGHWYALDELTAGVGIHLFSGRIYFCYQQPWSVQNAGYEPAQAVTDPNFFLRYDKFEITFTGSPYDVANLTSIDYWSIPISLQSYLVGKPMGSVNGLLKGATAQMVADQLTQLSTPPVSGLSGPGGIDGTPLPALVPGQFKQYPPGPVPGTQFARIIGPSSYPPAFPLPGAIPVTPYDLFKEYLSGLLQQFGPGTVPGKVVSGLGDGVIANVAGYFAGVGPDVPPSGPQSAQDYQFAATIDEQLNITLQGTSSGVSGQATLLYKVDDLFNPSGIYGGNTPYYFNGASTPTAPVNDIYGWVGGDLFSGLNIGAVGSETVVNGSAVGAMQSQQWFTLKADQFFKNLQPNHLFYNSWAATLSKLSEAYNFAYSDRFAAVFVSLSPADADALEVSLLDGSVVL